MYSCSSFFSQNMTAARINKIRNWHFSLIHSQKTILYVFGVGKKIAMNDLEIDFQSFSIQVESSK